MEQGGIDLSKTGKCLIVLVIAAAIGRAVFPAVNHAVETARFRSATEHLLQREYSEALSELDGLPSAEFPYASDLADYCRVMLDDENGEFNDLSLRFSRTFAPGECTYPANAPCAERMDEDCTRILNRKLEEMLASPQPPQTVPAPETAPQTPEDRHPLYIPPYDSEDPHLYDHPEDFYDQNPDSFIDYEDARDFYHDQVGSYS